MKNLTIVHVLLFLLMLLTYTCASAQTREDYVVTNTQDTLYGKVKPLDYGPEPKVQLQTQDKKKVTYSIFETKAYRYKGEIYIPVKNYSKYQFMRLMSAGYLSLYAFQTENQNSYNGLFLTKMDGTSLEVPNLAFKKNMTKFLGDCGTIGDQIQNGELSRNDLEKIIEEYNACINSRTIEKQTTVAVQEENVEKTDFWKSLNKKINASAEFEGKSTALEMVTEIISKVSKGEKIPSFLIDGLKNVLRDQESLKEPLETALKSLTN